MRYLAFASVLSFCIGAKAQCTNLPDNWGEQTIDERLKSTTIVALVKVLSIQNRMIKPYGETYDVTVDLMCAIKADRGTILPQIFTITQMGDRDNNCPNRRVIEGADYIIFLKNGDDDVTFVPDEVNQQQCVWEATDENFKLFPGQLNHCYLDTGCFVRNDNNWVAMTPAERAQGAEIIVQVRVTDIHYITNDPATSPYHATCELQCVMKQPTGIAPLPRNFNTTGFGHFSGQCSEKLVTKNHDFIMFLTRFYALPPLIGATVPPDLIENYFLSPQEVNQQQAVFNVTTETIAGFDEYIKDCPGTATLARVSTFTCVSLVFLALSMVVA